MKSRRLTDKEEKEIAKKENSRGVKSVRIPRSEWDSVSFPITWKAGKFFKTPVKKEEKKEKKRARSSRDNSKRPRHR